MRPENCKPTPLVGLLLLVFALFNLPASAFQSNPAEAGGIRIIGPTPTAFIASSDGTLIAVSEQGPRDAPAVIFIPGYLHSAQVFYNQLTSFELLPFHIITMDLRGQGYSGKPLNLSGYNFGLLSDDVHAVIQGLQLDRPILAAWSLGNIIAINYIQKYGASTLRGLDLIDPLIAPNAELAAIFATPAMVANEATSTDALTALTGAQGFITGESGNTVTTEQNLILNAVVASSPPFSRAGLLALPLNISYGPVLAAITIPVLIQAGSPDPLAIPGALALQQQLLRSQQTRLYPGGEHVPFILKSEDFNQDLALWLNVTAR